MKILNFKFQINKAFTLLEMLVVIGIIAVLIGMGSVSYSTAQKKARDAKRKGDLKAVQKCLEQYYSDNNNFKYPTQVQGDCTTPLDLPSGISCGGTNTLTVSDPLNNDTYKYRLTDCDSTGSKYEICATLETETPSSYCLSNQQ